MLVSSSMGTQTSSVLQYWDCVSLKNVYRKGGVYGDFEEESVVCVCVCVSVVGGEGEEVWRISMCVRVWEGRERR